MEEKQPSFSSWKHKRKAVRMNSAFFFSHRKVPSDLPRLGLQRATGVDLVRCYCKRLLHPGRTQPTGQHGAGWISAMLSRMVTPPGPSTPAPRPGCRRSPRPHWSPAGRPAARPPEDRKGRHCLSHSGNGTHEAKAVSYVAVQPLEYALVVRVALDRRLRDVRERDARGAPTAPATAPSVAPPRGRREALLPPH